MKFRAVDISRADRKFYHGGWRKVIKKCINNALLYELEYV